ncbi:MAG: FecR domain-containing protein [Marinoscillum sp.]
MPINWFEKYSQKHYSPSEGSDLKDEFDVFYELSEFDHSTNTDSAWTKCHTKLNLPNDNSSSFGYLWKIAAVLILVAGLSFVVINTFEPTTEKVAVSSKGQTHDYQLPDGSIVTLSKSAVITYDKSSFIENRIINLEGKAYFDVVKSTTPFHINTKQGEVEVLGTSFNLNISNKLDLAVYSGLVKVITQDQEKLVNVGERAVINNGAISISKTEDQNLLAWKTGEFDFHERKLKDVISLLEEYYNVNISASNKLRNCKITANFDKSSLDEVVKILSTVLNSEVSKEGNKITFKGQGCN